MMVMDATRLPNRAACSASRVTANAQDAPAEKLSPAPQISTGFSTGVVFYAYVLYRVDHLDAFTAVRHQQQGSLDCLKQFTVVA